MTSSSDMMNKPSIPYQYLLLGICLILAVLSVFTLDVYVIAFSSVLALIAVLIYKAWPLIEPLIIRRTNIIQLLEGLELSGDRSVAIRKVHGGFSATASALLIVQKSNIIAGDKVENIIAHTSAPFKYTLYAQRIELAKLLDKLQTSKGIKEIQLARIADTSKGRSALRANQLKKEIEQLEHDITSIGSGAVPIRVAYYLSTSAFSDKRFEAEARSKAQIKQLASEFDALLGSSSKTLTGDELIAVLRLDTLEVT